MIGSSRMNVNATSEKPLCAYSVKLQQILIIIKTLGRAPLHMHAQEVPLSIAGLTYKVQNTAAVLMNLGTKKARLAYGKDWWHFVRDRHKNNDVMFQKNIGVGV